MARAHDSNARRKLRLGQAVLLGVEFSKRDDRPSHPRWEFMLPEHLKPKVGYKSGYFHSRNEAVTKALKVLGVIE